MNFLEEIEYFSSLYGFKKSITKLPKISEKSKETYSENDFTYLYKVVNSKDEEYCMYELIYNSHRAMLFQYKREKVYNPKIKFTSYINRKRICYGSLIESFKSMLEYYLPLHEIRKAKIKKLLENN